jgi:hypothetical protein
MKTSINSFIGDDLANKVKVLSKALYQAENMVLILEQQNESLKDALNNLASENKEDCIRNFEAIGAN